MTASIGTLLDRLHEVAFHLSDSRAPKSPSAELGRQRRGWYRLSRAYPRALERLPFEAGSPGRSVNAMITASLHPMATRTGGDTGRPSSLDAMAECVGAIADLLVDRPSSKAWRRPDVTGPTGPVWLPLQADEAAARGLQASLLAPLYAAARWSSGRLAPDPAALAMTGQLGRLWRMTEPHALTPVEGRTSTLEYLSTSSRFENSLGGALREWERWASLTLEPLQVTRSVFEGLAADLTILNAAVLHGVHALHHAGQLPRSVLDPLDTVVRQAHGQWKALSTWPDVLRLEGRRPLGQVHASRMLRDQVARQFRSGRAWITPEELGRQPADQLAPVVYAIARSVGWTGEAVAQSLRETVQDRSRVWHHAHEVEGLGHHEIAWRWIRSDLTSSGGPGSGATLRPVLQNTRTWTVYPQQTDASIGLAQQAAAASQVGRDLFDLIRDAVGHASPPETIPALEITHRRVHAMAPSPSRSLRAP